MTKTYPIPTPGLTNDLNDTKGKGPQRVKFTYDLYDAVAGEWCPGNDTEIEVDGLNPHIDLGVKLNKASWAEIGEDDHEDVVWAMAINGDHIESLLRVTAPHQFADDDQDMAPFPEWKADQAYLVAMTNDGRGHCSVIVAHRA